MARSRIGRNTSRRDFLSGIVLIDAAGLAPLAELRADPATENASIVTT
jgi:hypothetical protein